MNLWKKFYYGTSKVQHICRVSVTAAEWIEITQVTIVILECTFIPVNGKEVHSGNIEAVTTKEKAKFPQEFFPECKWSRKGFLRTRWSISGTVFDLINIHLFHDASNFIAMETVSDYSFYCETALMIYLLS